MKEELKRIIWMKKGIRNNSSLIFTEIFIDSVKEGHAFLFRIDCKAAEFVTLFLCFIKVKWLNREHISCNCIV